MVIHRGKCIIKFNNLNLTSDCHHPSINYGKMYGTEPLCNEPRFNEILVITNTIQRPTRKMYLDITNACQQCDER